MLWFGYVYDVHTVGTVSQHKAPETEYGDYAAEPKWQIGVTARPKRSDTRPPRPE